ANSKATLSHRMTLHSSLGLENFAMRSRPSSPDTDALGRAPPRDPVPASSRRLMAVPEPSAASSAACWSSRLRYACPCCQVVPGGCSPEPESSRSGHLADTEQIVDFGESALPNIAG